MLRRTATVPVLLQVLDIQHLFSHPLPGKIRHLTENVLDNKNGEDSDYNEYTGVTSDEEDDIDYESNSTINGNEHPNRTNANVIDTSAIFDTVSTNEESEFLDEAVIKQTANKYVFT